MRFSIKPADRRLLAILAVGCIAATTFSFFLANVCVDVVLRREAETTGRHWAIFLAGKMDIKAIVNGEPLSPTDVTTLELARHTGDIFRFKLFDGKGNLKLVSDDIKTSTTGRPLSAHNPTALKVLGSGRPFIAVKRGEGKPDRPAVFTEAYVPVIKDERVVAVVEVYIDHTRQHTLYRQNGAIIALLLAIVTALAFGVPALAFYRRTRDIRRADEQIRYLAHHDALTQLLNRGSFTECMDRILHTATHGGEQTAVFFIDMDHFKQINDRHGHEVGDELLRSAARRVMHALRDGDVAARYGGDEFAIVQSPVRNEKEAEQFAARLWDTLRQPYEIDGYLCQVGVSIGFAVSPDDGRSSQHLIKCADTAMYCVKQSGRNGFRRFEGGMDRELQDRLHLESMLRLAVSERGFDLHFQPLFRAEDGQLTGFEALLRLVAPDGGFLSPADFVPVAEEIGLIEAIGSWVIRRAACIAADWPEHLTVSVNVSAAQFETGDLVAEVRSALADSGLAPHRLEMEITESVLLKDTGETAAKLTELKEMGVRIAMDDFGTGYSSLGYLWRFDFDKIKLDRSFMQAVELNHANTANILDSIITMCHAMKMVVTAEGVETEAQATLLRNLNCDEVQGFLYGEPVPEAKLSAAIRKEMAASGRLEDRAAGAA